jgi:hypothetical protein
MVKKRRNRRTKRKARNLIALSAIINRPSAGSHSYKKKSKKKRREEDKRLCKDRD